MKLGTNSLRGGRHREEINRGQTVGMVFEKHQRFQVD